MPSTASLERIAHLLSPLLVWMVLSAASTAALPPTSLPTGGGSMNTSEALSPVEEGDDPGNGSMTRSTIVAIPIVLGLAVILLLALYCLRHWTSIARRFFGKGSNRPLPDPRGLSDELVLQPTASGSSTTPMVQKVHVAQPPPLLHRVAERVSAPLVSALGQRKDTLA